MRGRRTHGRSRACGRRSPSTGSRCGRAIVKDRGLEALAAFMAERLARVTEPVAKPWVDLVKANLEAVTRLAAGWSAQRATDRVARAACGVAPDRRRRARRRGLEEPWTSPRSSGGPTPRRPRAPAWAGS